VEAESKKVINFNILKPKRRPHTCSVFGTKVSKLCTGYMLVVAVDMYEKNIYIYFYKNKFLII
jgi:hypothetical protein